MRFISFWKGVRSNGSPAAVAVSEELDCSGFLVFLQTVEEVEKAQTESEIRLGRRSECLEFWRRPLNEYAGIFDRLRPSQEAKQYVAAHPVQQERLNEEL